MLVLGPHRTTTHKGEGLWLTGALGKIDRICAQILVRWEDDQVDVLLTWLFRQSTNQMTYREATTSTPPNGQCLIFYNSRRVRVPQKWKWPIWPHRPTHAQPPLKRHQNVGLLLSSSFEGSLSITVPLASTAKRSKVHVLWRQSLDHDPSNEFWNPLDSYD
jgi:hypothetical protein